MVVDIAQKDRYIPARVRSLMGTSFAGRSPRAGVSQRLDRKYFCALCVFNFVVFMLRKTVNTKAAKGGHKVRKEERQEITFKLSVTAKRLRMQFCSLQISFAQSRNIHNEYFVTTQWITVSSETAVERFGRVERPILKVREEAHVGI